MQLTLLDVMIVITLTPQPIQMDARDSTRLSGIPGTVVPKQPTASPLTEKQAIKISRFMAVPMMMMSRVSKV